MVELNLLESFKIIYSPSSGVLIKIEPISFRYGYKEAFIGIKGPKAPMSLPVFTKGISKL